MTNPTSYIDTRGHLGDERLPFTEVIVAGIAPGGGLFVPQTVPPLSLDQILSLRDRPYWQRATRLFERFDVDLPHARIASLMKEAYGSQWNDPHVAPVRHVAAGRHVLELWHGPTSAFKDMALQCMPRFFSESIDALRSRELAPNDYLVLVATSGDTGKAALEGFADREHTGIVVFYPAEGVSDIQRLQMVTQPGGNVGVFGVRGNFDDCQTAVKAAFSDREFSAMLADTHGLELSSANSINWGRLLPQVVYYVSAYVDMVGSGAVAAGDSIDVCVPTGNFGNILAAYYAKRMGVPIGRLLCASNENNVLADFIATGTYDISDRTFVTTPSPSMDILVSSNLERLLFELCRDPERVQAWMSDLVRAKRFTVDRDTFEQMRELLVGDYVTNEQSLDTVRQVYSDHGYLLDPHTAVAWEVADRLADCAPVLVVSTAHWAKFGVDVYRALRGVAYTAALPADAPDSGIGMVEAVAEMAPSASPVPEPLRALASAEVRWPETIDRGKAAVEHAVLRWLAARDVSGA